MSYKPSTIDTIIFDLGGVLVDWNPEYIYLDVFQGNRDKMKWFLDTVCTDSWNLEQDSGRLISEAEMVKIQEFPEYEFHIKLFYSEWHNMFKGTIAQNVSILNTLQSNSQYATYALTNWCAETWPRALELFPFFRDFDGAVVSGIEKTCKPNAQIYQILINRYNIHPEKSVFIDDKLENVKAAISMGFTGVHYTPAMNLKNELLKLKISV